MGVVIAHVVEPFATGINTFLQELVFSMPTYTHIIIHGVREDTRDVEEIKKEYKGKVKFIKWAGAHREINLLKDRTAYFQLKKILKSIQFDILHLHSSKAGVVGRILGITSRYKNIVYTPNAASFLRTDISNFKKFVYKCIEKIMSLSKAKVVSSCQSESDAFNSIGVKNTTILNGVTISNTDRELKTKNSKFNVVFCAKVTIQKNPILFNDIASHYRNTPEVTFTWVGDGEMLEVLSSKNINVTGWKSKDKIYRVLSNSDLYLSTASWEGLSIATIEASAFGLPLVLSECAGNQDMIKDNSNGFLFNSKEEAIDKIEFLRNNPQERKEISRNSKNNYDINFGNFRCGLEYKALYLEMLKENKDV